MELQEQIKFIEKLMDQLPKDYFKDDSIITSEEYQAKKDALRAVWRSLGKLETIRGMVA